jgi:hypothetical protein
MAGASPPSSAASRKSKKLWTTLSSGQKKTVQKLRTALSSGVQIKLTDWHLLGVLAQSLSTGGQAAYGQQTLDGLGELVGCAPSVIAKARKFARLYSASNAVKLEGKLSWSVIERLLWIDDESIRSSLEADCLSKKMSLRKLEREIRSRVGRRRRFGHGGRSTHRPESLREALADFDRLVTSIVRWYRALETEVPADSERTASRAASRKTFDLDQIPPLLRHRISDAIHSLEEVRQAVQGAMEAGVGEAPSRPARRSR